MTYARELGSKTLTAGTLAATSDAAVLHSGLEVNEVLVQNDPDNVVDILLGTATAQPIQLRPGDSITIPCQNLNSIYAKTVSSTATVGYLARS